MPEKFDKIISQASILAVYPDSQAMKSVTLKAIEQH